MEPCEGHKASFRFKHSNVVWAFTESVSANVYIGNYTTIGQVDNPNHKTQSSILPVKFGDGVAIGNCCTISENVTLGNRVKIGNNVVIRSGVTISDDCTVGHGTVFEGDAFIGENTLIHAQCHITRGVNIGRRVFIAPYFVGANDPICLRRDLKPEFGLFEPVGYTIEDGARIGIGVVVLPGVRIGKNAQIAAHSIVTKDVEEAALVMGSPAKFIRKILKEEWCS